MDHPEGFIEVVFEAFKGDEQVTANALICYECQAVILRGGILKGYGPSYADKHLEWHKKVNEAAKKLSDIYDAAAISGSKDYLDAQADWEKMDPIQVGKRRR